MKHLPFRTLAVIFFCATTLLSSLSAEVHITELCASNRSVIRDQDGDFSDWFEVYNAGTEAVNMDGWSVTDDPLITGKWFFPPVVIQPGGYLVVFASGKNRLDPARELHTNFKCNILGEYLGLYEPDGVTVATEFLYPPQVEDFSYGLSQNGTFVNLIASNAPVKVLIPQNDNLLLSWTEADFNDSGWAGNVTGVGYDESNTYVPFINTDVIGQMNEQNTSAYIRVPFTITDPAEVEVLKLRMRYDDGFVAFINGLIVARRNAPGGTPTWNSSASDQNDDNAAVVYEDIELDEVDHGVLRSSLRAGENVLAIQGLNRNLTSSDFLIMPELDGLSSGDLDPEARQFFPLPTPGSANLQGYPGVAPRPTFSETATIFSGNMSVTLSTEDPDGVIRYTTNGTEPTESSAEYTGPISFSGSTLVRAKTFIPGLAPSPTISEGFIGLAADMLSFSSDLPIIIIDNFGRGSPPADPHLPAYMAIFEPVGEPAHARRARLDGEAHLETRIGIKIRGSSTQNRSKKAYKFEAWDEHDEDKDITPLGMPRESDWILYGAYNFDKAHIRNAFIYTLSNQVGQYAARTKFCEVFFNTNGGAMSRSQDYIGVYTFMEKLKRGPDRVDVEKLTADHISEPEVSGGYMAKIDRLDPGDSGFNAGGRRLGYVYPKEDDIVPEQAAWIRGYIDEFVNVLNSGNYRDPINGYAKYIDPLGWVEHHILNVLAINVDALRLSTYMFKGRNDVLVMGPIWDFDRAMESTDGRDDNPLIWNSGGGGTQFFTYPWWERLFQDPDFWQLWIDRWTIHRRGPLNNSNMLSLIDSMANEIREAQPRDLARWGQTPRFGGFQGEVDHLISWMSQRANWIDSRFVRAPRFNPSVGRKIDPGFELTMTAPGGGTIYYTLDGTDPRQRGGALGPWAERYTGPITLEENVHVFARVRGTRIDGSDWSGPTDEAFWVTTPPLVVTEIMYHPSPPSFSSSYGPEEFEFIEIMNASDAPQEIAGAQFTNGIGFTFDLSEPPLGPGEFIVVVRNLDAFSERYDTRDMRVAGEYSGHLASEGEIIGLIGPLHEPILMFEYSDQWYPSTDGKGESLNIIDPFESLTTWGNPESWSPSSVFDGTPGDEDPGLSNLGGRQKAGDSNQDGAVDISDAISFLRRLFLAEAMPPICEGASLEEGGNLYIFDLNSDNGVNVSDVIYLLTYLFKNGPPPDQGTDCIRVEGCPNTCL